MTRTTRLDRNALEQLLGQQLDVITRHQALDTGMSGSALRQRLRPGGSWRKLLPGVYLAATGTPDMLQQEIAALLYAGRGSLVTGPAALRYHRIGTTRPDLIDVLVPAARQRHDAAFVRLHRTIRMPERSCEVGRIRYVPPPAPSPMPCAA
jgi:hypothetical protein